jgi:hypothetical protein
MAAALDQAAVWGGHIALNERLTLLAGEIDVARRDISAWKHWLDEWAPRLRRLWDGGAGLATGERLMELRGKIGWLEDCHKALESHALVTVGRLESIEQAFGEWNGWAQKFADRLERLEAERDGLAAWCAETRGVLEQMGLLPPSRAEEKLPE